MKNGTKKTKTIKFMPPDGISASDALMGVFDLRRKPTCVDCPNWRYSEERPPRCGVTGEEVLWDHEACENYGGEK